MTPYRLVDGHTILYAYIFDGIASDSENNFYVHCMVFVKRNNLSYCLCHLQSNWQVGSLCRNYTRYVKTVFRIGFTIFDYIYFLHLMKRVEIAGVIVVRPFEIHQS